MFKEINIGNGEPYILSNLYKGQRARSTSYSIRPPTGERPRRASNSVACADLQRGPEGLTDEQGEPVPGPGGELREQANGGFGAPTG